MQPALSFRDGHRRPGTLGRGGVAAVRGLGLASARRRGFTLVEMLTVVAIFGFLLALLLPAIQAARESARNTQCKNHLKQIGAAVQSHVAAHGHFPTAGWGWKNAFDPDAGYGVRQPGGWIYQILAYADQLSIRDIGVGVPKTTVSVGKMVRDVYENPIPILYCPTRPPPQALRYRQTMSFYFHNPATNSWVMATHMGVLTGGAIFRPSHYAGSAGRGPGDFTAAGLVESSVNAPKSEDWFRDYYGSAMRFCDGIFGLGLPVRPAHVTDGLSRTLLVGESYLQAGRDYESGATNEFVAQDQGWTGTWDFDTIRYTGLHGSGPVPPKRCSEHGSSTGVYYEFGSPHPASVNVVFCDGSIRTFEFDVDPTIFQGIGSRNGDEVLDF